MSVKGFDDTIDWYDKNAKQYASRQGQIVPVRAIEKFLKMLPAHPYILDAGCGPGREEKAFIKRGAKVVGVDISEGLLAVARESNPDVEYIQANFLELPMDDESFDGVWSHASLVHLEKIEDVRLALREFLRVLKPSGVLYVFVKAQMGEEKTEVVTDSLSNHERFFRYYAPEELAALLAEAGFKIMSTELHDDMHGRRGVKWIEVLSRK